MLRPAGDGRIFYGWKIVAACAAMQVLISGLFLQAYGAYVVLIQSELGWSITLLSAGFSLARTESAFLGPIQGHLIDRFGPRAMMRIGVLAFGIGFVLFGMMQSPWQFFAALLLIAIGSSFCGLITVAVAVVKWFVRRRATAMGLASTGVAVGGMIVPLVVIALTAFGWRAVAVGTGIAMCLIGPLFAQVLRRQPSDLGLVVDGLTAAAPDGDAPVAPGNDVAPLPTAPELTARQALRTLAFWQISIGHGLAVMLVNAVLVHLIPHLTRSFGYSLGFAGAAVAIMTVSQLFGMIAGGVLGDRFSKRFIITTCMCLHAIAALVVIVATRPIFVVGFAVLHGLAWGIRGPLQQAWRADLFGTTSFGAIMGYSSLIVMLGAAGGPILGGVLYDTLGSYNVTFTVLAVLAMVGALSFALVRPPRVKANPL